MSTHTLGPWAARIDPHGKPHYWIKTPGGFVIARVSGHGESDAALIAAAPEMLEALKRIITAADDPDNEKDSELVDQIDWTGIRQTIAKAEGRA